MPVDPDVVLRLDRGPGFRFSGDGWTAEQAMVNGGAGVLVSRRGRVFSVIGFTVRAGRIVAIDVLAALERISRLGLREKQ